MTTPKEINVSQADGLCEAGKNGHPQDTNARPYPQGKNSPLSDIAQSDIEQHAENLRETLFNPDQILDPFPIDVYPDQIQRIIASTNESLQYPIDFIGTAILYAASLAIGNTHKMEVKRGHIQSAVIWIALVGSPGTSKTHPLKFAIGPIFDRDKEEYQHYKHELREYKQNLREKNNAELERPIRKKTILSDYTPEALAACHDVNRRGIGVYNDELAGWFKNFNRYNAGSEQERWLESWSLSPINIDRRNGDSFHIENPFISVAGTIQPTLLDELAKDRRKDNGFIDRILFTMPDGLRKLAWTETEIPENILVNYHEIMSRLLNLNFDPTGNPYVIRLSKSAKEMLFDWQHGNTEMTNACDIEPLKDVLNKFDVHTCRIALLLQMIRWACAKAGKNEIDLDSVQSAIQLAEYFRKMNIKVFHNVNKHFDPLGKLPDDKRKLYEALPRQFNRKTGLQIAENIGISRRAFDKFIKDDEFFSNAKYGVYRKAL